MLTMSRKISKERARTILSGGAEPHYDPATTAEELDLVIEKSLYWYRQNYKLSVAKGWVREYLESLNRTEDAELVSRAGKDQFRFVSPYCRMVVRGFPVSAKQQELMAKHLTDLLDSARSNSVSSDRPNVADRVAAKGDATLCLLEPVIDSAITAVLDGKRKDTTLLEWIKSSDLNRPLAIIVRERLNTVLEEFSAASSGTDPDLKEGYSHFTAKGLKYMIEILGGAIQNLDDRLGVLRASRKPRKRKAQSAEKQIKGLKFLARSEPFGVDSVKPQAIIGAQGLIVFNTKNSKATVFTAVEPKSGLAVKGSTVVGFDSTKSFEKTVRKPDEFVKNADGCRKTYTAAVRYLNGVKTKPSEPTGRINKHCIILQVNQ
jgi:hypothetical protein